MTQTLVALWDYLCSEALYWTDEDLFALIIRCRAVHNESLQLIDQRLIAPIVKDAAPYIEALQLKINSRRMLIRFATRHFHPALKSVKSAIRITYISPSQDASRCRARTSDNSAQCAEKMCCSQTGYCLIHHSNLIQANHFLCSPADEHVVWEICD